MRPIPVRFSLHSMQGGTAMTLTTATRRTRAQAACYATTRTSIAPIDIVSASQGITFTQALVIGLGLLAAGLFILI